MSQSTTGQQLGPAPTGLTIIKIATDLPVSGKDIRLGKPAENGARLAVDQANANHTLAGYTLVFKPKDDVGPRGDNDPAVGARNVTAFVAEALVAGIVGPLNSRVEPGQHRSVPEQGDSGVGMQWLHHPVTDTASDGQGHLFPHCHHR